MAKTGLIIRAYERDCTIYTTPDQDARALSLAFLAAMRAAREDSEAEADSQALVAAAMAGNAKEAARIERRLKQYGNRKARRQSG